MQYVMRVLFDMCMCNKVNREIHKRNYIESCNDGKPLTVSTPTHFMLSVDEEILKVPLHQVF